MEETSILLTVVTLSVEMALEQGQKIVMMEILFRLMDATTLAMWKVIGNVMEGAQLALIFEQIFEEMQRKLLTLVQTAMMETLFQVMVETLTAILNQVGNVLEVVTRRRTNASCLEEMETSSLTMSNAMMATLIQAMAATVSARLKVALIDTGT